MTVKLKLRCAIYTRKSHEEGLELEYNSLDAQYDAGLNFIKSQKNEGWIPVNEKYDDGGYTGSNIERPALKRLIEDIQRGHIDVVVVYKIDRLSRSLADFARLVEIFDKHNVTFVSVTQHFNTTTSMGRLTLNILLSFAQFEREVTGERIRDKFAASKARGIWMGGVPPLGYDVKNRKLIINRLEAKIIAFIYGQYLAHGSSVQLVKELEERCYRGKSWITQDGKERTGKKIDVKLIRKILRNPVYNGQISHKGKCYPGEHEAIISDDIWQAAQQRLNENKEERKAWCERKTEMSFFLRGVIFDQQGYAMTPSFTRRHQRNYRYYVSTKAMKEGYSNAELRSIPADEIETLVISHIRQFFTAPEILHRTFLKAQQQEPEIKIEVVREGLKKFDDIWDQLFPLEQNRLIRLIIKKIQVNPAGMDITYQPNGIMEIYDQIAKQPAAA